MFLQCPAPLRPHIKAGEYARITASYEVNKWDEHGLTASYGEDESSRCQHPVLTLDFDSGAVCVADIPTRKAGCEAFAETDSYKLVRGKYYVDATPGNDLDKKK